MRLREDVGGGEELGYSGGGGQTLMLASVGRVNIARRGGQAHSTARRVAFNNEINASPSGPSPDHAWMAHQSYLISVTHAVIGGFASLRSQNSRTTASGLAPEQPQDYSPIVDSVHNYAQSAMSGQASLTKVQFHLVAR